MAISTYSDLVSGIYKWLVKDSNDPFLTSGTVDNVIYLAEAEMSRRLNVRQLRALTSLSLVAGTNTVTAPTDLQQTVAIYAGSINEIQPADPAWFINQNLYTVSGPPKFYYLNGTQYVFGPVPDTDYTLSLDYMKRVPNLSSGSPTNTILTAFPDLYLTACLKQAYILLQDDANEAKMEARLERHIAEVNKQAKYNNMASNSRGKARGI